MKIFCEVMLQTIVLVAILFGIIFVPVEYFSERNCEKYHGQTGRETKYISFDGCYVMGNDAWYTKSEYEATITAKDAISKEN